MIRAYICQTAVFVAFRTICALLFSCAAYLPPRQKYGLRAVIWERGAARQNTLPVRLQIARHAAAYVPIVWLQAFVGLLQNIRSTFCTRRGGSLLFIRFARLFIGFVWHSFFVLCLCAFVCFSSLCLAFLFLSLVFVRCFLFAFCFFVLCFVISFLLSFSFSFSFSFPFCSLVFFLCFSIVVPCFYIYNNKINIYSIYIVCVCAYIRARIHARARAMNASKSKAQKKSGQNSRPKMLS